MNQSKKELESIAMCFMKKTDFQKGLIIGLMLNEEQLDKMLKKVKEDEQLKAVEAI